MPTFDAENQVRFSKEQRPFVAVSRNGELLPEVRQVIALIAKHGLALATGHSSPSEGLLLLREGQRQGVQRMVVTHAMLAPVQMDVPQMQEAAKLGAFIEFVGGSLASSDADARMTRFAEAIRTDRSGLVHPVVGSRAAGQSAAGRWLRRLSGGAARQRIV